MLPQTPERERSIETPAPARRRRSAARSTPDLTPWQRVLVARHPNRPNTLDYVERLFTDFDELHGDRRFADDHAIVAGFADYKGAAGRGRRPPEGPRHQAEDLPQLRLRAAGGLSQGAARDAAGAEVLAGRSSSSSTRRRPIPGIESEERGVAEAIALNLREMMMLEVPIIVIVCGEGGSGGALGIAIGDRVLMQEFSVYSVIPPEGLRGDPVARRRTGRSRRRTALKITAPDLLALGLDRRDHPGADRRRAQRLRRGRRRSSTRRCRTRSAKCQALSVAERARRALREVPPDGRRGQRVRRHRRRRPPDVDADRRMKSLLWHHLPCDDEQTASAGRGARTCIPTVARLLCLRGLERPRRGRAVPQAVARSPPRSVPARRHGRRRSSGSSRRVARKRAHRDPRRLRRRRHHLDRHPAARARDARRRRRPLHPRAAARRLRPAAGGDRAPARRGRAR